MSPLVCVLRHIAFVSIVSLYWVLNHLRWEWWKGSVGLDWMNGVSMLDQAS